MAQRKKQEKQGKKVWFVGAAVLLVAALAFGAWALFFRAPQTQWVMKVNGEPVWEEEFSFLLKANRVSLLSQIQEEYGEEAAAGEQQEALLREACKELVISHKVQQQLAVSLGVVDSFDFYDLQKQMEQKNADNQQAVKDGKPVYGLMKYDLQQYYSYAYSNAVLRSKELLAQGELKPGEDEIKAYYEANKETEFARVDQFAYLLISGDKTEEVAGLIGRMEGMTREELEAFCREHPQLTLEQAEVDAESFRTLAKTSENLSNALLALEAGESSGLIDDSGSYRLLYCISRTDSGIEPLEEVRQNIENTLVDHSYNDKAIGLARQAQVETDDHYFKK